MPREPHFRLAPGRPNTLKQLSAPQLLRPRPSRYSGITMERLCLSRKATSQSTGKRHRKQRTSEARKKPPRPYLWRKMITRLAGGSAESCRARLAGRPFPGHSEPSHNPCVRFREGLVEGRWGFQGSHEFSWRFCRLRGTFWGTLGLGGCCFAKQLRTFQNVPWPQA